MFFSSFIQAKIFALGGKVKRQDNLRQGVYKKMKYEDVLGGGEALYLADKLQ